MMVQQTAIITGGNHGKWRDARQADRGRHDTWLIGTKVYAEVENKG